MDKRWLSDDFVLRQDRETPASSHHSQSVDIDGITCELLDPRGVRYYPWVHCFYSAAALIFVVPLSAYCQDQPASASLVSEMYALN